MKKINKKGFTLTELIVVIAVIAILAAVLIPTLTGYIEKARISADNQEVAVLNKLLLGAEIDEIEFENVPQLKKYLEEEMDYDGDYSLSVKGNYLFFDTEKYEFVIVKEDEVEGLKMMANDYALATTLASPEGLLVDNDRNEVLLVGGNGDLVKLVEEIRNIGNSIYEEGQQLSEFKKLEDSSDIKNLYKNLFNSYDFGGAKGIYKVSEDGTVSESSGNKPIMDVDGSKTTLSLLQLREQFHNTVIAINLDEINSMMKGEGNIGDNEYIAKLSCSEKNLLGGYTVTVDIKENSLTDVLSGIFKAIEYIKAANCNTATIIGAKTDISDYESIVSQINNFINNPTNGINIDDNLGALLVDLFGTDLTVDTITKVDLSTINTTENMEAKELLELIKPIVLSLNLKKGEMYTSEIDKFPTSFAVDVVLKGKEDIKIIAEVNDPINGKYTVEYVFKFVVQ